jgi:hypothetical protein
MQGSAVLTPEAAGVADQIKEKKGAKDALLDRRDKEAKEAIEEFERQRDSYDKRIEMARSGGDNDSARRLEAEEARLQNPRPKIMAKYEPQVAALDEQIGSLEAKFDQLRSADPTLPAERKARLQAQLQRLEESYQATAAEWQQRKDDARERWASAQKTEREEATTVALHQTRLDKIAESISTFEQARITIARQDQVRRLAGRFAGKRPEDVSEGEANTVAIVWFGSLAFIAALAGPITAMVALALQRIAAQAEQHSENRLARLVRRMLIRWRWRRVRTVKVPVEIPVDREVEKRVEVPVEKVIKEILYVPILTDDPEALRRALGRELPPEIADLVKVSSRSGAQRTDETDRAIEEAFQDELQLNLNEPLKARAKRGGKRARPA